MTLPLAAALWVLGQAVLAPPPSPDQVAIAADHAHYDGKTQIFTGDGHAELRTAAVSIRADHLRYDEAKGTVHATNALLVIGTGAGFADAIDVDLTTLEARLTHGTFVEKHGTSLDALLAAPTKQALEKAGTNSLALHGRAVRRISADEVEVDGLAFTPCDCNPLKPHWQIRASHADVRQGDHAWLTWPVIYVYQVPVLALPVLYLPLANRKSGLLIPTPSHTSTSGWHLDLPVFLTLGESYDLTFTPGYFFGGDWSAAGLPPTFGVKGPQLETELRYVPSTDTSGTIDLDLIDDRNPRRDPVNPTKTALNDPKVPKGARGLRGDLKLQHAQQLGGGWEDRLDLALASDGYLFHDLTTDIIASENQYLRSTAELDRRADDSLFVADLVYRQDVRTGFDLFETDRDAAGHAGPRTLQKFPELLADFPLHPLGPLFGGLAVRYTRLSPIAGRFGDEGLDGVYNPAKFDEGQGDRIFQPGEPGQPGEREARSRLDLNPLLSTRLSLGRFLELTPYAALRQDLYVGELTGDTAAHGYVYAGIVARTELARRFGDFTHAITPSFEFRYAPTTWGDPVVPYDEIDQALPEGGITQAVAQISQRLFERRGTTVRELARLTLGQEFDFRKPQIARDSFASAQLNLGPLRTGAIARYDLTGHRLAQLTASLSAAIGSAVSVYGLYDDLLVGGSDRLRQGIDALVGLPYPKTPAVRVRQLRFGGQLSPGCGLHLSYEAIFQPDAGSTPLAQQTFGLGLAPACNCWRLNFQVRASRVRQTTFGSLDVLASLVISNFGTIGTGP